MTTTVMTKPEGVTEALHRGAVEKVGENDPQWLRERRIGAWEVYETLPMPTTKLENWRYTNLKKLLKLDQLGLAEASTLETDDYPEPVRAAMAADHEGSGHVVELDGGIVHIDLDPALVEKGVVLTSLRKAVETHPELLEKYLASEALPASEGKFSGAQRGSLERWRALPPSGRCGTVEADPRDPLGIRSRCGLLHSHSTDRGTAEPRIVRR